MPSLTRLVAVTLLVLSAACDDASSNADLAERKLESEAFLAKAAAEPGAETLAGGIVKRTTRAGSGASPAMHDTVEVSYTGRIAEGTVFDSTANRGPARFKLAQVIKCWTEAVSRMQPGEVAVLTCPADTAYGDRGAGSAIPGGSALEFEVTLHDVIAVPASATP